MEGLGLATGCPSSEQASTEYGVLRTQTVRRNRSLRWGNLRVPTAGVSNWCQGPDRGLRRASIQRLQAPLAQSYRGLNSVRSAVQHKCPYRTVKRQHLHARRRPATCTIHTSFASAPLYNYCLQLVGHKGFTIIHDYSQARRTRFYACVCCVEYNSGDANESPMFQSHEDQQHISAIDATFIPCQ